MGEEGGVDVPWEMFTTDCKCMMDHLSVLAESAGLNYPMKAMHTVGWWRSKCGVGCGGGQ